MSKVITFSRLFPAYHPKAGEPTYFVEKLYNSIYKDKSGDWSDAPGSVSEYVIPLDYSIKDRKHHTIRSGHRWKVGDKFSPRVWSGRPYASKQIVIAHDIEIKKLWDFEYTGDLYYINRELYAYTTSDFALGPLARNDGLDMVDLLNWFQNPFKGQIICWNDQIEY